MENNYFTEMDKGEVKNKEIRECLYMIGEEIISYLDERIKEDSCYGEKKEMLISIVSGFVDYVEGVFRDVRCAGKLLM